MQHKRFLHHQIHTKDNLKPTPLSFCRVGTLATRTIPLRNTHTNTTVTDTTK